MIGYGNSYFISTILDSGSGGNPPVNTVAPVISGNTTLGSLLSSTTGTWTGDAPITYSYQWKRNGNNIIGATSSLYTIQVADSGAALTCQVTATNSVGSASATSNTITANTFVAPTNTVAPSLSGTAQEGQTLTTSTGSWTGTPVITYTYQWKRNGSNIGSATNSTYTLVTADVGQSIKCTVTATNAVGSASADSNTVVPVSAFSYLLDTYSGAAAAYSLRKLSSTYSGNCIRVRRSSDNTEQDFGFVNNVLDTASLLTFVGAGDGFVTTWYDQSGNTKNLIQTVGTGQPAIVRNGVIITQLSKPAIQFGYNFGIQRTSILSNTSMSINSVITAVGVGNKIASSTSEFSYSRLYSLRSAGNDYDNGTSVTSFLAQASFGGFNPPLSTYASGGGVFLSYTYNTNVLFWSQKLTSPTVKLYIAKNGGATSNANTGGGNIVATTLSLGGNNVGDSYLNGYIPEFILYPSDQTTNKTGIEANINTYYSIY